MSIKGRIVQGLNNVVSDIRSIELEDILNLGEGPQHPDVLAGLCEVVEDNNLSSEKSLRTDRKNLELFLLTRAKAQIAYNLLKLVKGSMWTPEALPYEYKDLIDSNNNAISYDSNLLIPVLREIDSLHSDMKKLTFIYGQDPAKILFAEGFRLDHHVVAAIRKDLYSEIKLSNEQFRDKIKRYYDLLNIFDTYQDRSTDPKYFDKVFSTARKIRDHSASSEDYKFCAKSDTRYEGVDSRPNFIKKAADTEGNHAIVIIDIGGMNVANRQDMAFIAEKMIKKMKSSYVDWNPTKCDEELDKLIFDLLRPVDRNLTKVYTYMQSALNFLILTKDYRINSMSIGGDELRFDILMPDLKKDSKKKVELSLKMLLKWVEGEEKFEVYGVPTTGRAGISFYNGTGIGNVERALQASDKALERAKDIQKEKKQLYPVSQDSVKVNDRLPVEKVYHQKPMPINIAQYITSLNEFSSATEQEYYMMGVFEKLIEKMGHTTFQLSERQILENIAEFGITIPSSYNQITKGDCVAGVYIRGDQRKHWNDKKEYSIVNTALKRIEEAIRYAMVGTFDLAVNIISQRMPNTTIIIKNDHF